MSFISVTYWFCFFIALAIYWILTPRKQLLWLLALSYLAYGFWSWNFLGVLLLSTTLDFWGARWIEKAQTRRRALVLTILCASLNISILVLFKVLHHPPNAGYFSAGPMRVLFEIGFPIGVSFYTFQSLGYVFDVYRQKISATKNWFEYALYVSFYPQLIAGPIERSTDLLPQLQNPRSVSQSEVQNGLFLILLGLFKKIYVADSLAYVVAAVFGRAESQGPEIFLACILMTFRVYADFSGYCDMARGSAALLGIKLSLNYLPFYYSRNPAAFWRSWNISLSRWISDYLIQPRRLLKQPFWLQMLQMILVFLLIGIWHGWGWNWILFGLFNGVCVVGYRILGRYGLFVPGFQFLGLPLMFLFYAVCGGLHALGLYGWSLERFEASFVLGWMDWSESRLILQYAALFLAPLVTVELLYFRKRNYDYFPDLSILSKIALAAFLFSLTVWYSRFYSVNFIYFSF